MHSVALAMLIVATSVAGASIAAAPVLAAAPCTAATVTGDYGMFPLTGPSQETESWGHFTFDGSEKVMGHETDILNNGFEKINKVKGKYDVKPDCVIKMKLYYYVSGSLDRENEFEGVVVNGGAKIDAVLTHTTGSVILAPMVLEAVQ